MCHLLLLVFPCSADGAAEPQGKLGKLPKNQRLKVGRGVGEVGAQHSDLWTWRHMTIMVQVHDWSLVDGVTA
jgi:hypothetical protein